MLISKLRELKELQNVLHKMRSRQWTTMSEDLQKYFEDTDLTFESIGKELGMTYKMVWLRLHKLYTKEQIDARKKRTYRNSKLGRNNPMYGKQGELHHNYQGVVVADGNGYNLVLKPDWFTGRVGSRYVFEHHVVLCRRLGITEIPKGFVVHHIDGNPLNNKTNNLALLTTGAHTKLHCKERAETRRKP